MEKKAILIVEDEGITALDIKAILITHEYHVAGVVSSGELAIDAVNAQVPDLILMDIHLAGKISGIDAAEKILSTHNVPIIYLTAYSEPELVAQAKMTRPYGYLIKPVSERAVLTKIEIALYKFGLDRDYQQEYARLEERVRERTRDLQQANEDLLENEQKFREFINLLPEVVFECDITGKLTLVNDNSFRFFGYTREELEGGVNLFDHIIPEDRERVMQGIGRIAGGGTTTGSEYTGVKRDGSRFPILVYTTRVIHHNRCTGIRGILVDITERKKAEHAMQQALSKLGLLNNITRHDIINKLTALNAYLGLAGEVVTDNKKTLEYIERCTSIVATINKHVEFMRDYQEIGIQSSIWLDPTVTIRHVLESCYCPGITVKDADPGWEIFTDPLFEKVIYNLIENAIRHGEHVTTITFIIREEDDGLHVVYDDDGAGIPEESKDHLFEKAYGKNTGLGLFLAREILGITDITIRETGVFGKGARFEITVPKGTYRKSS
ncbi:MAG: PAS domain S-box protein [Methanoregula sp.]|jgi:PAS domain S-box-containing protein|nr:PAS domain S-box protein [Methanoregula sp.]